jgi:hypothetical protein
VGCGKVDKQWQPDPCLIQYRSSSVSCFTKTQFSRLISVDSDISQHTEHELFCSILDYNIFGPVPLRCKENYADAVASAIQLYFVNTLYQS